MLRHDKDGTIRLTIEGVTIATLDRAMAATMTTAALVRWENQVREDHYERSLGFWSRRNQHESRAAEVSPERLRRYPSAKIQSEADFNAYWAAKRDAAIDN